MAVLKQSTAYTKVFSMVTSASHYLPLTGAAPVVNISKAGGTFGVATNSPATEIANGFYKINMAVGDLNTLGDLAYYITAASGDAVFMVDQIQIHLISDYNVDGSGNVSILSSLKKNVAAPGFMFTLTSATTGGEISGLTGIVAQRSLSGAGYAPCANPVTEVGNGTYAISLAATDTNAAFIMLRITHPSANTLQLLIPTQP
jgi:hypothetical protein